MLSGRLVFDRLPLPLPPLGICREDPSLIMVSIGYGLYLEMPLADAVKFTKKKTAHLRRLATSVAPNTSFRFHSNTHPLTLSHTYTYTAPLRFFSICTGAARP